MKVDKDLVVFISGGASGFGECTALRLSSQGCKIIACDIDQDALDALKTKITSNLFTIKADVTKEDQVKRAVEEGTKHFGALHVAFASAGVMNLSPLLTERAILDTEAAKKQFEINVYGAMHVAKYAAAQMAKNKPNELG